MGGLGSGNHTRKRGDTLEQHRRIDANAFKKKGLLEPGWHGRWVWTSSDGKQNFINVTSGRDDVQLSYRYRIGGGAWKSVSESIPILYRECHLGGTQAYFGCPKCARRVRFLYGAGARFLCRHCHDLVHASSREGQLDRELRKVRKIRRRLGADPALESHLPRPKHMRLATYERLRNEVLSRENELMLTIYNRFEALQHKVQPPAPTSESFWS